MTIGDFLYHANFAQWVGMMLVASAFGFITIKRKD
jgi:hypothetical protein